MPTQYCTVCGENVSETKFCPFGHGPMSCREKDNPLGCSRCKFGADKYYTYTQWCDCGSQEDCDHWLCGDCKDEIDVRLADRHDRAEATIKRLIAENKILRATLKDKDDGFS